MNSVLVQHRRTLTIFAFKDSSALGGTDLLQILRHYSAIIDCS